MSLPPEIVERILIYCDGKTLLKAPSVCKQWSDLVQYLDKKYSLWYRCCLNEIPRQELTEYLKSHDRISKKSSIWCFIYKNWLSWQDIPNLRFEVVLSPPEIPRITCIDVFEKYIAVGSEDGRVRVFTENWKPILLARHIHEKVTKVSFFYHHDGDELHIKIVMAYPKVLIIDDLFDGGVNYVAIESAVGYNYSVYKDCICYQKTCGIMIIERLLPPNDDGKYLKELWFRRIYSPNNISSIKMWNGNCVILISNNIQILNYSKKLIDPQKYPDSDMPEVCVPNFSSPPNSITSQRIPYILRDDIIIVLHMAENSGDKEYMEVIILQGGANFARKLFSTSEIFQATITCLCLYGNTFVVGLDNGIVYFYHVPSWKHFSIKDYQKKIIIGKHPITNIIPRETKDKRIFFVTSSFNIHEVVGFCSTIFP